MKTSNYFAAVFSMLIAVAGVASAQSFPTLDMGAQEKGNGWIDQMRGATVSFGRILLDPTNKNAPTYSTLGSGVVIALSPHKGFILTAKHMVDDPLQGWHPAELRIRFDWEEHKTVTEDLGFRLPLLDANGTNLWTAAADGSDIVEIPLPSSLPRERIIVSVPYDALSSEGELFEGASILVVGFPGVMGNSYLVRPILRSGIVAWTNPDDPENKPFMVDANLYPGNSGGPVVRVPTGMNRGGGFSVNARISLLGIVSKGPYQDAPVQAGGTPVNFTDPVTHAPVPATARVLAVGGIGLIEPASEIKKLVLQVFGAGPY